MVAAASEKSGRAPMVHAFNRRSTWDAKFSAKKRVTLAALGRMSRPRIATHTATFKLGPAEAAHEAAERAPAPAAPTTGSAFGGGNAESALAQSFTYKFPIEQPLAEVQQAVGAHFGWPHSSLLYVVDGRGWDRPVTSHAQLAYVFADWERTAGPRTRRKYEQLFAEVEAYMSASRPPKLLQGAGAAWEIACREAHHDAIGEGFLEALHSVLSCGHFAAATHAAAAVNMLIRLEPTLERLIETTLEGEVAPLIVGLEKALRTALRPTAPSELAAQCRGTPAFLARQPVLCLHRLIDPELPEHRRFAAQLAQSHCELTLWRLLMRVAPRRQPLSRRRVRPFQVRQPVRYKTLSTDATQRTPERTTRTTHTSRTSPLQDFQHGTQHSARTRRAHYALLAHHAHHAQLHALNSSVRTYSTDTRAYHSPTRPRRCCKNQRGPLCRHVC